MLQGSLLSILIWLPVMGAIAALMTGGDENANRARWIGASVSIINLLLCIPLYLLHQLLTKKDQ